MRRFASLSLMATLALGAMACGKDSPTAPIPTIEQTTFASSLNVDLTKMTKAPEGYYFQDLVSSGSDIVRTGDSVAVSFNGYLPNGTAFTTGGAGSFRLGVTPGLMQGWVLGLPGAPNSGRRRLIIPPELGYGDRAIRDGATGAVLVPSNSILVYDITIVRVTP